MKNLSTHAIATHASSNAAVIMLVGKYEWGIGVHELQPFPSNLYYRLHDP